MSSLKNIIEAMLIAYAEPISIDKICEVLAVERSECEKALEELKEEFESDKRGFIIKKTGRNYQIVTNSLYYFYVQKLFENVQRQNLSQAALEVLAIIAYKQPVTKSAIEQIRGVNCEKALSRLLERNIIEEIGRLDTIGKPILYGTTEEFLRVFGIESIEKLPEIDDFYEIISKTENDSVETK